MIYEDQLIAVGFPEKPATIGHIEITCKKNVVALDQLSADEVNHMFQIGSRIASVLFEELGAHGTNIILKEGEGYGQKLKLDIVARSDGDSVGLTWTPKEIPNDAMEAAEKGIKDKADLIGVEAPPADIQEQTVEKMEPDEDNYLIKSMNKMP